MKYICLDYLESGKFENMSECERHTVLDCRFEANALIKQGFEPASDKGSAFPRLCSDVSC
jgi:hypothetical protein